MTIEVVVVDDSALVRGVLTELINRAPDLKVVGVAADPYEAREMIRALDPDVITLDVEMPKMDGLAFLERLMKLRPMPVVMVSTLTERGAQTTLRALELGAVDFIAKPVLAGRGNLDGLAAELAGKLRAAAGARVARRAPAAIAPRGPKTAPMCTPSQRLIAFGSSTGGTEALREVLTALPAEVPAIVITQHMPPGFTTSFAARLDNLCAFRVKEAADGEPLLNGHAYLAPGGRHLSIARGTSSWIARVTDDEPVNLHKPSVDVMFRSVARYAGAKAIGVMLTGMGADGAEAMRVMREAGSHNIAQDEASCVVYGMPRAAVAVGATHESVALSAIAGKLKARLGLRG